MAKMYRQSGAILAFLLMLGISAPPVGSAEKAKEKKAPPKSTETQLLHETIGVLSAQGIFLTYVSIGTIADGYAAGTYDYATASDLLSSASNISRICRTQLESLSKAKSLQGDDIKYVYGLIEVYDLLIAQSDAYATYMETEKDEHREAYSVSRDKAWEKIAILLDIKE